MTTKTTTTARQTCTAEVWVMMDADGCYVVGSCPNSAREAYAEQVRPLDECEGFRLVKVTVKVPLPKAVELTGEASEFGSSVLTEVQ